MRLGVFLLLAGLLAACSSAPVGKVSLSQTPAQPARSASPAASTATNVETDDRGIISEINLMRRDPASYAQQLLLVAKAFRPGQSCPSGAEACVLTLPNEDKHTIKDARAYRASVVEAAGYLRRQPPLPALAVSDVLQASARDHLQELSRSGRTDKAHYSQDGSSPRSRMERRGRVEGKIAENIMFGFRTSFGIVAGWLIDHGVADRGHRVNLLDPDLHYVGTACGPHPTYRVVCVTDFAAKVGR